MTYIYEDGDGYAIVEADNPELALKRIYQRDLASDDREMMRVSPFILREVTLGRKHRLEFELDTPVVNLVVTDSRQIK